MASERRDRGIEWQRKEQVRDGRRSRSAQVDAKNPVATARRVSRESETGGEFASWLLSEAVREVASVPEVAEEAKAAAKAAASKECEAEPQKHGRKCHGEAVSSADGAEGVRGCTRRRSCTRESKHARAAVCSRHEYNLAKDFSHRHHGAKSADFSFSALSRHIPVVTHPCR